MHFALGLLLLLGLSSPLVGQEEPMGQQVVQAVSPLPEALRDGATVLSHRGPDGRKILQEGTNNLICLADDPDNGLFMVICYHDQVYQWLSRVRELERQGKKGTELRTLLDEEVAAGKLSVPDHSAAFMLLGFNFEMAIPLSGVYVPYATAETTGFSESQDNYRPWLMLAGTPKAHIMFSGK